MDEDEVFVGGFFAFFEEFEGWRCDLTSARRWEDLPPQAQRYVTYIEREIGCPITYISVGPERDSIIIRK